MFRVLPPGVTKIPSTYDSVLGSTFLPLRLLKFIAAQYRFLLPFSAIACPSKNSFCMLQSKMAAGKFYRVCRKFPSVCWMPSLLHLLSIPLFLGCWCNGCSSLQRSMKQWRTHTADKIKREYEIAGKGSSTCTTGGFQTRIFFWQPQSHFINKFCSDKEYEVKKRKRSWPQTQQLWTIEDDAYSHNAFIATPVSTFAVMLEGVDYLILIWNYG